MNVFFRRLFRRPGFKVKKAWFIGDETGMKIIVYNCKCFTPFAYVKSFTEKEGKFYCNICWKKMGINKVT